MSFTNMFNMPNISGPMDFGSIDNRSSNASSSPTTFFHGSLLSPANISLGGATTPGASTGSEGRETGAYIQRLEQELIQAKRELDSHKTTHEKLVESHQLLMKAYIECMKRPLAEHRAPLPDPCSTLALHTPSAGGEEQHSKSDYPYIRFWSRSDWLDFKNKKKDASILGSEAGPRGGTRCAQGENVSMQYLEDSDGEVIDGRQAASIREFARTIWVDFYDRGMAPKKWREASRRAKQEYAREMEARWPILCYCENNWKAHEIATSNYPQWHKHHSRKKLVNESDGQARKRRKVEIEDEPSESESENTDGSRPEDENDTASSSVPQCDEGSRMGILRPHARALTRTDPLAKVFENASPSYRMLDVVSTTMSTSESPAHPHVTQMVGPVPHPVVQMTGPGVAPTPVSYPVVQMTGPGVAPTPLPYPAATQMVGPGVAPPAPTAAPSPSPIDTSAPPEVDTNAASSSSRSRPSLKEPSQRKYAYTTPLKPGIGISAKNICAQEWLKNNPGGKTGEFNRYWDCEIDANEKAAYEEQEAAQTAQIQAKKKKHGLPPRRAAARK